MSLISLNQCSVMKYKLKTKIHYYAPLISSRELVLLALSFDVDESLLLLLLL